MLFSSITAEWPALNPISQTVRIDGWLANRPRRASISCGTKGKWRWYLCRVPQAPNFGPGVVADLADVIVMIYNNEKTRKSSRFRQPEYFPNLGCSQNGTSGQIWRGNFAAAVCPPGRVANGDRPPIGESCPNPGRTAPNSGRSCEVMRDYTRSASICGDMWRYAEVCGSMRKFCAILFEFAVSTLAVRREW